MAKPTNKGKAVEQYTDIDDDKVSPLGAAIIRDMLGMSIEELLDESDTKPNNKS